MPLSWAFRTMCCVARIWGRLARGGAKGKEKKKRCRRKRQKREVSRNVGLMENQSGADPHEKQYFEGVVYGRPGKEKQMEKEKRIEDLELSS